MIKKRIIVAIQFKSLVIGKKTEHTKNIHNTIADHLIWYDSYYDD